MLTRPFDIYGAPHRFGKDFEAIDSSLPDNFGRSLMYGLNVGTTIISIAFVTPAFLIAFAVISTMYWWYGRQYTRIARELRRLDSVTKSPLFSAYGETVAGVAVIRAFGGCSRALALVFERIDSESSTMVVVAVSNCYGLIFLSACNF